MAITIQSAKQKGRRLQQWVRDIILELWPKLEPGDVVSTPGGVAGPDIQFSPAAQKIIPFAIEAKARNQHSIYGWYDQASQYGSETLEPILIVKQDRRKPLVVLDAWAFFTLMRQVFKE